MDLTVFGSLTSKVGQEADMFSVFDFNFGAYFSTSFGKDFDGTRTSDPNVTRTVMHFIKHQKAMIIAIPKSDAGDKLAEACYKKTIIPSVQIEVWTVPIENNFLTRQSQFVSPTLTPLINQMPGVLVGTVALDDVSVTGIWPTMQLGPGYGSVDVLTLAGKRERSAQVQ